MTTKRNKIILTLAAFALVILALPVIAAAQGRGRGLGRGNNRDWKCSIFVNCHDARDGRLDRGGRNRSIFERDRGRGERAGYRYRNRYNMNDYWRQRHFTNLDRRTNNRLRFRSRSWRNR
jgi:hypothetical protein